MNHHHRQKGITNVRRHAKASSAGSTSSRGSRLGSSVRGASATRGVSPRADGSGAPSHRRRTTFLSLALAALALLAFAPLAQAERFVVDGFAPQGSLGGQLNSPTGIAVDNAGAGSAPAGTIYVTDASPSLIGRVTRFNPDGSFNRTWGWDVVKTGGAGDLGADAFETCTVAADCQFIGGVPGGGVFPPNRGVGGNLEAPEGIAVSPTNGHVYVTERNNRRVAEFDSDGNLVRVFGWNVADSGATGTGTLSTASNTVSSVSTTTGAFTVGQTVTSSTPGDIPAGTKITSVGSNSLTLSQKPIADGAETITAAAAGGNVPVNESQTITVSPGAVSGNFKLRFTAPNPQTVTAAQTTDNIPWNATVAQVQAALDDVALTNIGAGNVTVSLNAGGDAGGGAGPGGPWTVTFDGPRYADVNVNQLSRVNGSPNLNTNTGFTIATVQGGADGFESCTDSLACKQGATGTNGGEFSSNLMDPVVDSSGNVWVADAGNRRIQEFDASGNFIAAYGYNVNGGGALESCISTAAGVCKAGTSGPGAGQFSGTNPTALAFDSSGNLYANDSGNHRVQKFNPTLTSASDFGAATFPAFTTGAPTQMVPTMGGSRIAFALSNSITASPSEDQLLELDAATESLTETSLVGAGVSGTQGLALNTATGKLYQATSLSPHIFPLDSTPPPTPALTISPVTATTDTTATLHSTVDPLGGLGVDRCKFQFSTDQLNWSDANTATGIGDVEDYSTIITNVTTTSGAFFPGQTISGKGLQPGGQTIAAVEPGRIILSEPAPSYGGSTIGVSLSADLGEPPLCESVDPDGGPQALSQVIHGLTPATHYYIRFSAHRPYVAGSTVNTGVVAFDSAPVPPVITGVGYSEVTDTSFRAIGKIDPRNSDTGYVVEYGTTPSLGSHTDPVSIGGGTSPMLVSQVVSGLDKDTTYYFKLVATNAFGATSSFQKTVHTRATALPLPDNRAYEQVSPVDKDNVNAANFKNSDILVNSGVSQQASVVARDGSAAAYTSDAPFGGAQVTVASAMHRSVRGAAGWQTSPVVPLFCAIDPDHPSTPVNQGDTPVAFSDPNLGRAVVQHPEFEGCGLPALDPAAPSPQSNLYLADYGADPFSYQLLNPAPSFGADPSAVTRAGFYQGAAEDGSHIVYSSTGQQLGGGAGDAPAGDYSKLYDYQPGGGLSLLSRDTADAAFATSSLLGGAKGINGGNSSNADARNAISTDGSHAFFQNPTGGSGCSTAACELYVREGGATTEWVSEQECSIACPDASGPDIFQWAAPGGGKALFLSGGKLTDSDTSPAGTCDSAGGQSCDLYRWVQTPPASGPFVGHHLIDLSVDNEPGDGTKAGVLGVIGASDDGDTVFFAARGQIVSGEDTTANSVKLYRWRYDPDSNTDSIDYLGLSPDVAGASKDEQNWSFATRQVSADGRYLLFDTTAPLTVADTDIGADRDVYRWDAQGGWRCLSCQQPGAASNGDAYLATSRGFGLNFLSGEAAETMSADGQRVFFTAFDPLSPADTDPPCRPGTGSLNGYTEEAAACGDVYEWHDGALSLISGAGNQFSELMGVGNNGNDVFFLTRDRLVGWDTDNLIDVYDARVGGGFPEPPATGVPCDLNAGACEGAPSAAPATTGAGTAAFQGQGNPKPKHKKAKKKKHHKKKHHKKKHHRKHKKAKHHKRAHPRAANHNRRAAR